MFTHSNFMFRALCRVRSRLLISLLGLLFAVGQVSFVFAQTSAFTYQGRFTDGGTAANGTYDLQFKLFDGNGNQIGSTLTNGAVQVSNGVFTVQLDYGAAAFSGADRSLEIGVRLGGSNDPYTVLAPRQQLTSAVYAIRAGSTSSADNANQLGGVAAGQYVQTSDSRLTDARTPAAGSSNYIQNTASLQTGANFNISGNGTAGGALSANAVNAVTQFNIAGQRVLSNGGDNNTFAGVGAGSANSGGARNAFFGTLAGSSNTAGSNNSFFGWNSGGQNQGFQNSFFGASAGASNKSANGNSFFGYGAGSLNTTGGNNSFFGANAGLANSSSSDNSFFGKDSGANNVGVQNSFFGSQSGTSNKQGNYNAFFGYSAGNSNQSGNYNSFVGTFAGANSTGDSNSFFGFAAGIANTTGVTNSFFGLWAGHANTTGSEDVYVGVSAGDSSNGSFNTFVGYSAGQGSGSGIYDTAIGESADIKSGLANATAIGAKASVQQSDSLVLGSISGVNGASADTSVGIGTTTPKARLHIATNGGNILAGNAGCNSGFTGIGFGSSLSGCTNYSLLGNGSETIINRPTGGTISFRENNTPQMSITSGGIVSINTLGGAGITSLCRNAIDQISICSSSLRYKTNIQPFIGGLSVLNRLRPIKFDWKDGGAHDLGFGAEDIAKVEPLLVTRNDKGEVEGVKYDRISAVLVNAVKEQEAEIEAQREQIARQQSALSVQGQQIEELKSLVSKNLRRVSRRHTK